MEAKTAFLALCLAAGGAEVHATGCNPLSTQDDVAAGLASMGVETYAMHGVNAAEYRGLLVEALSCCPDLIIDDGGDLLDLLSGDYAHLGKICSAARRRRRPASIACTPAPAPGCCPSR